jgi:cellobiose-specific phosphotransferase system component IIB
MAQSIDMLPTTKSIIDFSNLPKNSFNSVFYGYNLKQVLDDVLLVKYVDETDDGSSIIRNGLHVPINTDSKAWRIGEVILAGPNVKYAKVGEHVCFPNNLGVPVSNLDIDGYGPLRTGIFLNEQRIFGICSIRTNEHGNESVASHNKKSASKQRRRN